VVSDLVRHGGVGRLYHGEATVGLADAGPSGRARLDAIARWLQDIAYADVVDAGLKGDGVWVTRRTRIVVERFPRLDERLSLATFCSATAKLCAERRTTISGEDGARIETLALWVNLKSDGGAPRRLSERFGELFGPSAEGRRASVKLRHPAPANHQAPEEWRFRAADLDLAGHVNNAVYWQVLEEEFVSDEPASIDVEIEYRLPARHGAAAVIRQEPMRWILSAEGELHASLAIQPEASATDTP
jgi:acyl-ACP thioesterase